MNWKRIGYLPYWISDTGLVKNKFGHILVQSLHHKGYPQIRLCVNYIKSNYKIHRLVAEAFLPNPYGLPQVAHKDNNKLNNCVWNLKWTTNEINMAEANRDGLRKKLYEKARKLTAKEVLRIRKLRGLYTQRELGVMFGVEHTTIWAIQNRITYRNI